MVSSIPKPTLSSFDLRSRFNDPPNDGNQTISALIDNVLIGGQYTLTRDSPFALTTTDPFSVTTGSHTLTLESSADGDHMAFVSDVSVTGSPTPEPSTFVIS